MHLIFTPMRHDVRLTLSRQGDVLTINGEAFDFTALPEGASLPGDAIRSDWIAGEVSRKEGRLHIPLILPHGANAPGTTRHPEPITLNDDGPVDLPAYDTEEPRP